MRSMDWEIVWHSVWTVAFGVNLQIEMLLVSTLVQKQNEQGTREAAHTGT